VYLAALWQLLVNTVYTRCGIKLRILVPTVAHVQISTSIRHVGVRCC